MIVVDDATSHLNSNCDVCIHLAQIWEDAKALAARGYRHNAAAASTAAAAARLSAGTHRMTREPGEHAVCNVCNALPYLLAYRCIRGRS
jgi:hypothetical protein